MGSDRTTLLRRFFKNLCDDDNHDVGNDHEEAP